MSRQPLDIVQDGATTAAGAGEEHPPELNYLAKDYASFRQLILDRLAQLIPEWQERHVPDMGIALVDLLAYLGDRLSYFQDAVATEAYIGTARQRVSLRRHARLVDYPMHEGCNARTFIRVEACEDCAVEASEIYFVTTFANAPKSAALISEEDLKDLAPLHDYAVFEPMLLQPPAQLVASDLPPIERLKPLLSAAPSAAVGAAPRRSVDLLRDQAAPGLIGAWEALSGQAARRAGAASRGQVQRAENARDVAEQELLRAADALLDLPGLSRLLGRPVAPDGAASPDEDPAVAAHLRGAALRRFNRQLLDMAPDVIQGRGRLALYKAHNKLATTRPAYDSNGRCLGLTVIAAAVGCSRRPRLSLRPGDLLLIERRDKGMPEQPRAVRLTTVRPLLHRLRLAPSGDKIVRFAGARARWYRPPRDMLKVTWAQDDALPAEWKIIPKTGARLVARGNVLLADHGQTVRAERLAPEELPGSAAVRVRLAQAPLTFAQPLPAQQLSAKRLLLQDAREAVPQLALHSEADPWQNLDTVINISGDPYRPRWRHEWAPRRDLLSSGPRDLHFVAELDDQGAAQLRFGDGAHGARPEHLGRAAVAYQASYRIGNGNVGNLRPGSLCFMVYTGRRPSGIGQIFQPLAASGGLAAEPLEEVRLFAPDAFRSQIQRAISAEDYATIVMREFADRVQRAVATLGWNGSRYEAFVAVDPWAAVPKENRPALCREIRALLVARYRRMGHAVIVREATYVPIDLALDVTLAPGALAGVVRPALLDLLTTSRLPNGQLGFFHPDNLTFGQGIYLSRVLALAHKVPGIQEVRVKRLQRLGHGPGGELERGVLALGPLEIACLNQEPRSGQYTIELNFAPLPADTRRPPARAIAGAEPAPGPELSRGQQ